MATDTQEKLWKAWVEAIQDADLALTLAQKAARDGKPREAKAQFEIYRAAIRRRQDIERKLGLKITPID